jgi:hypothetical protein
MYAVCPSAVRSRGAPIDRLVLAPTAATRTEHMRAGRPEMEHTPRGSPEDRRGV